MKLLERYTSEYTQFLANKEAERNREAEQAKEALKNKVGSFCTFGDFVKNQLIRFCIRNHLKLHRLRQWTLLACQRGLNLHQVHLLIYWIRSSTRTISPRQRIRRIYPLD